MKKEDLIATLEAYAAMKDMFAPREWAQNMVSDFYSRYLWQGIMLGSICTSILWLLLTVGH